MKKKKTTKSSKTSYILFGVFASLSLIGIIYCSYKTYIWREYLTVKPENAEKVVQGLEVRNTITLHNTDTKDYLIKDNIKIRNDFKDYEKEEIETDFSPTRYIIYEDGQIKEGFYLGKMPQYIDLFTSNDLTFFGEMDDESTTPMKEKFEKSDRKKFLEKNNIKDDIDYINFVKENYYIKTNIFMSKKKMAEIYAFNLLTSIAIPEVDSITLIDGDYRGYIFNGSKIRSINIIYKEELYVFTTIGEKFQNDSYIEDLFKTLVIE